MTIIEMIHREVYRFLVDFDRREDMELFLKRNGIHYKIMETMLRGNDDYYTLFEAYSSGSIIPSMTIINQKRDEYHNSKTSKV